MYKYLSYFKNEFIVDLGWYVSWILGVLLYNLFMVLLYPGTEAMKAFLAVLEEPAFQALVGNLDTKSSLFLIWMAIGTAFLPIMYAAFGFLTGIRITLKSINDGQGEIIHSINLPKLNHLIMRFLVALTVSIVLILDFVVPLMFPIVQSVPIQILSKVGWVALLFLVCSISLGILIGLLISSIDKAQLISLGLVILFYSLQIIGQLNQNNPGIKNLNTINVLMWFNPTSIMFGVKIDSATIMKLIFVSIVSLILGSLAFVRKDLVKNSGVILPGNLGKNRMKSKKLYQNRITKLIAKPFILIKNFFNSPKNSPFVILARPVEKKFPIAADFIYSEKKVIIIMFFVIALFWPGQLSFYPGAADINKTLVGLGSNAIFKLFVYGHNLYGKPFLWWIGAQAVGAHWFYVLPLTFHWIKKITRADGENRFGEIIGSEPVNRTRIIFERIFACFLMMIAYVIQMLIWLLIVETSLKVSYNQTWEIISIILVIPLYMFILNLGIFLTLVIKKRGFRYSSIIILAMLLSFFASILGNNLNNWYIRGFFGLYDPIEMIVKGSLSVNNYGSIILIILSLVLIYPIKLVTKNYNWLEYDLEKGILPETYPTN